MPHRSRPPDHEPIERIGAGTHSEVWRARERGGGRLVALKVARHDAARARLAAEARLLRALGPVACLPALLDHDPRGGWLALELVEGTRPDTWARGRSIPEVARMLARIADALAELHLHGVAHGDLKPANVLVRPDGRVRLLDLGVAALDEPERAAGFRGTLGYAAPEQLRGERTLPASDLYALGILAWELLVGRSPWDTADPAALAWLPLTTLPEPPASLRPTIPAGLDGLVLWLLAHAPTDRPPGAAFVARQFRTVVAHPTPSRPVVGLARERAALRRLLVEAREGRPVVALVTGPPGSGRRAVITEVITTAVREGLRGILGANHQLLGPEHLLRELQGTVPVALSLRAGNPAVHPVATRLLEHGRPGLLLVHADHVDPDLVRRGAVHLPLPPLTLEECRLLLEARGHDPARAPAIHAASGGRPGAILALVRGTAALPDLPPQAAALFWATRAGPVPVAELARRLSMGEHEVLDHAEPLLDRGLLVEADGGAALAWALPARALRAAGA